MVKIEGPKLQLNQKNIFDLCIEHIRTLKINILYIKLSSITHQLELKLLWNIRIDSGIRIKTLVEY